MSEHIISVDDDGKLQFVYDDELFVILKNLGETKTKRASHVEPTDDGNWIADMEPSGGPILGPFNCRQVALDAECAWVEENVL